MLTVLFLSNNKIGVAGATAIADTLRVNAVLTRLELDNNKAGCAPARPLRLSPTTALPVTTALSVTRRR